MNERFYCDCSFPDYYNIFCRKNVLFGSFIMIISESRFSIRSMHRKTRMIYPRIKHEKYDSWKFPRRNLGHFTSSKLSDHIVILLNPATPDSNSTLKKIWKISTNFHINFIYLISLHSFSHFVCSYLIPTFYSTWISSRFYWIAFLMLNSWINPCIDRIENPDSEIIMIFEPNHIYGCIPSGLLLDSPFGTPIDWSQGEIRVGVQLRLRFN